MSVAGSGDSDIGGATAEEFAEGTDIFQANSGLKGIDIDAATPDGEDIK